MRGVELNQLHRVQDSSSTTKWCQGLRLLGFPGLSHHSKDIYDLTILWDLALQWSDHHWDFQGGLGLVEPHGQFTTV